jgi:hypothetical protein
VSYDGPSQSEWLAEFRARPEPYEVVLYRLRLPQPVHDGVAGRKHIASLRISRIEEPENPNPTGGFYLFMLDEANEWVNDTWHEDAEDAFEQSQYRFGVEPDDWHERVDDN